MSLVTLPVEPEQTAADAATEIRSKFANALVLVDIRMREVRQIVATWGRPAIAAELGSDAADLLTVYNSLKNALEVAKEVTLEELP